MGFKNNDRCLSNPNLAEDEPIFVLRSQDRSAPGVVQAWLDDNADTLTPEHRAEAEKCVDAMFEWQRTHPERVKNPD